MGRLSLSQLLMVLAIIVIILLGVRRRDGYWPQLVRELKTLFPVFSAETTKKQEAEFVRDSRPKRFPLWIIAATIILATLLMSWIAA